ncbi:GDSL-type esterase/lipase family protein [Lapidilactobacillus achengensis]|uniref:GDSL-type esterase/lipase family protein n=1 Tax=Lapidilactobacillus achengensis TaxID=2486000 RepID=A0ABW1UQB8_9LACO|nr:GDSL-type esterase/lipase family protein [Lapidilactobacillus achengensis]
MPQTIVWKHLFSNFHNLAYRPVPQQITCYQHNVSGEELRVELNNRFDEVPLQIKGLQIAATPDLKDAVNLTFNGQRQALVDAGRTLWSDPVHFPIRAGQPFYLALQATNTRNRINSLASTLAHYLVNVTSATNLLERNYFYGVDNIQVTTAQPRRTVAFFGDSLVNQGLFTSALTQQLYQNYPNQITTFNAGISGNRLLRAGDSQSPWNDSFGPAGKERFMCDVLCSCPDVVVFLEGVNDLFHPGAGAPPSELPTAAELIGGISQLYQVCQRRGVSFIPLTITPFKGARNFEVSSWTPAKEAIRQTVNRYLLTLPNAFDLAHQVALNSDVTTLAPAYDCGDHLHFSPSGATKIGQLLAQELAPTLVKRCQED